MQIKFYGVMGSAPRVNPVDLEKRISEGKIRYGGDTTCLEVVSAHGEEYIFDAGTGIIKLGQELLTRGFAPGQRGKANIFISHDHWDHIQGMPFFAPAYIPTNEITVYGEAKSDKSVQDILSGQMTEPYFPVPMSLQRGLVKFVDIYAGQTIENGLSVETMKGNHPNSCLAYAIKEDAKKILFVTDYEQDGVVLGKTLGPIDTRLVEFAKHADVLIIDAQFTPEEYASLDQKAFNETLTKLSSNYADQQTGKRFSDMDFDERKNVLMKELPFSKIWWGHSTYKSGIDIALAAGAKKLVLTHHDPYSSDAKLDQVYAAAQSYLRSLSNEGSLELKMAYDTLEFKV